MADIVETVAAGVHCIRVPNPAGFTRNVYLLDGPQRTLIDGGHVHAASVQVLVQGLAALGCAPADISRIVLTDITPDRVGAAMHPAFARARAVANSVAAAKIDYSGFTAALRRDLVEPLERDRRLAGLVHAPALRDELTMAFAGEGLLRADPRALYDGAIDLGGRRLVAVALGGVAHEHLAYRLEPDGLLFSGDLLEHPAALPFMLRTRGGNLRRLATDLRRTQLAGRSLPAGGEPHPNAARAAADTVRAIEQARSRFLGLLCAGPRELATLVNLWVFGRGLPPLALARETAGLLVLAADLAAQGQVEEVSSGSTASFRLAAKALAPLRRRAS